MVMPLTPPLNNDDDDDPGDDVKRDLPLEKRFFIHKRRKKQFK